MFAGRVGFYKQPVVAAVTMVAAGDDGNVYSSSDGITWTNRRSSSSQTLTDVVRAHNLWIFTGTSTLAGAPLIITSPDLNSYTSRSLPTGGASPWTDDTAVGIVTDGTNTNIICQLDGGARVYYPWGSADGINWTSGSSPFGYLNPEYLKPTYFDGNFVMPGGSGFSPPAYRAAYWSSSTATGSRTETEMITGSNSSCYFVNKISGSLYVAFINYSGGTTGMYSSTNGTTWTARQAISNNMRASAYSGTTIVTVGDGGNIWTSTNGTSWTSRTSGTTNNLWDVIWTGTQFVTVGEGRIITSADGTTWNIRHTSTIIFRGVTYA